MNVLMTLGVGAVVGLLLCHPAAIGIPAGLSQQAAGRHSTGTSTRWLFSASPTSMFPPSCTHTSACCRWRRFCSSRSPLLHVVCFPMAVSSIPSLQIDELALDADLSSSCLSIFHPCASALTH